MKDLLILTPPFTQLNTPYPATAYLKGFLNTKGISCFQIDLGIEVILKIFSKDGLIQVFDHPLMSHPSENIARIHALRYAYIESINAVISFLQGAQPSLARLICSERFLPQASRFDQLDDLEYAFGWMGLQDKAKHLCTLYLEDISDYIIACVDPQFGFSRYAERLGRSANQFDTLYDALEAPLSFVDQFTVAILEERIQSCQPRLVCMSVPFPGNLYSALRCGQYIKERYPDIKIAMGGGFPNTELRSLKETRVFQFVDYISLDDGELPIEIIASNTIDNSDLNPNKGLFKRTFFLDSGKVVYNNFSLRKDYKQADIGTPDYSDLWLDKYISVIEIANPMHSLWSDGRWNKLTMAHGCYWGKCTFCDVSLDYIKLYEPIAAVILVDRMEAMITQTGETGFHFVDEAAPPALMREVALEILKRQLVVTWWTNIRFEKRFTKDLCKLLHASGCVAVSGGLEVASDRLLDLIQKGVSVAQVAQVTANFTESNIMVHAYLMYGYPTQTEQETIDSLEMVRQLFQLGIIQSGFWHQFALTAHSPIGLDPEEYGIVPHKNEILFADNDIEFTDHTGINHEKFSFGLKKSLFNYMHGLCFDESLQNWFDHKIPKTTIKPDFIASSLNDQDYYHVKPNSKIIWIGSLPTKLEIKGKYQCLVSHGKVHAITFKIEAEKCDWLFTTLSDHNAKQGVVRTFSQLRNSYEAHFNDFDLFWYGETIEKLREIGLLVL